MPINKILVVDDSSTMVRIIVNTLGQAGYTNVVTADNGKNALDMLMLDKEISLVLSDWNMPEMKGNELLKAVRACEEYKKLPFIMITSRNTKEDILEAVRSGANDYLVKPFTAAMIKEKIERLG